MIAEPRNANGRIVAVERVLEEDRDREWDQDRDQDQDLVMCRSPYGAKNLNASPNACVR